MRNFNEKLNQKDTTFSSGNFLNEICKNSTNEDLIKNWDLIMDFKNWDLNYITNEARLTPFDYITHTIQFE